MAAGTTLFLLPSVLHGAAAQALLRGITFGAIADECADSNLANAPPAGAMRRLFARGRWERRLRGADPLGAAMLMQPLSLDLFSYSFVVAAGRCDRLFDRGKFAG